MKKCPPGEYYCNQDKKCKPIPSGYHTARGGFLVRDNYTKKNGNGNGNGHSNGNGNGNGSNGNGNGGNGGGVSEAIRLAPKTGNIISVNLAWRGNCLLYTSPSPRDRTRSRMPSSA